MALSFQETQAKNSLNDIHDVDSSFVRVSDRTTNTVITQIILTLLFPLVTLHHCRNVEWDVDDNKTVNVATQYQRLKICS